MSPRLFNEYMDGGVRGVNVWVLGRGLDLLSANGGRFEINQLLFAGDTTLVADSEEKLCSSSSSSSSSSSRTDRWVHFQRNAGLRLFVHT